MVRVAVIGVGTTGLEVVRSLHRKQAKIVAAFNRSSYLGEDVGEVAGIGNIGVKIESIEKVRDILYVVRPDVCMIQVSGTVVQHAQLFITCADLGINVLTIMIAFPPCWKDCEVAVRIHEAFKAGGCSLVETGYQEFMFNPVLNMLAACSSQPQVITIEACSDMMMYCGSDPRRARDTLNMYGFGESMENLTADISNTEGENNSLFFSSGEGMMGKFVLWLISMNSWELKGMKVEPFESIFSSSEIHLDQLKWTIPAKHKIGFFEHVTAETVSGIKVKSLYTLKLREEGDEMCIKWHVKTEDQEMNMEFNQSDSLLLTTNPYINRIPDVMSAPPGYIALENLLPLRFVNSLN